MPLLEGCQGAENIKLTYTPWKAGGMNFFFPPEEGEEGNTENQEEITYFIKNAVDYRIEVNPDKDIWAIFGTGISQSNLKNTNDEFLFCGDEIYWYSSLPQGANPEGITVEIDEQGRYYFRLANGREYFPLLYDLISESSYKKRETLPWEAERFYEGLPLVRDFYNDEPIGVTYPSGTKCTWVAGTNPKAYNLEQDSFQLTDTQLIERHYKFIAILEDGREQLITERAHQNVRTEAVEPFLADPVELEFSAPKGTYNFFLDEYNWGYVLRRQHVQFNLGNNLASISSDTGLPLPEYSYVCDLEECPEGTWALERGDVICCYKADGYAVKSFKKPEEV